MLHMDIKSSWWGKACHSESHCVCSEDRCIILLSVCIILFMCVCVCAWVGWKLGKMVVSVRGAPRHTDYNIVCNALQYRPLTDGSIRDQTACRWVFLRLLLSKPPSHHTHPLFKLTCETFLVIKSYLRKSCLILNIHIVFRIIFITCN